MTPRYFQPEAHRDRWMVSYLDVVTILLVFFVAAAAKTLAKHEEPKPPAPHEEVRQAPPPAPPPAPVPATPEQIAQDQIEHQLKEAGIEVRREPRGLVVGLPQAILFAPADDTIGQAALPAVQQIAGILKDIPNHVVLVGHADSVPIHSRRFKNNWDLSVARGMRLLELFSSRYQIDEARMSVSGDGSNSPADTNDTPEGRAGNRRVELVILEQPAPVREPESVQPEAVHPETVQ